MAHDLLHILNAAGLDEREARLYLAGLERGSAPASDYAKAVGMNRVTAYNTLEEMVQRGLMTTVKRLRAKWYAPVAPDSLAVEVRKNAGALERAIPELRSLQGKHYRKPHVRYFEGFEGVRRVYEDTLGAGSEILNFSNSVVIRQHWKNYDEEYVAERVRRGIHLRGIAPDDAMGRRVQGEDHEKLREFRLVPATAFDFTNEINIFDHKVAICSFDSGLRGDTDMFGIIIESKEVAKTLQQIFEMAWRYAGVPKTAGNERILRTVHKRRNRTSHTTIFPQGKAPFQTGRHLTSP